MDFEVLEREVEAAVAADEKYERENSAKFRAVEQRVATYDEFRDIVKASHLTPLGKKEKIADPGIQNKNVIWNTVASQRSEPDVFSRKTYSPQLEHARPKVDGTLENNASVPSPMRWLLNFRKGKITKDFTLRQTLKIETKYVTEFHQNVILSFQLEKTYDAVFRSRAIKFEMPSSVHNSTARHWRE